MIYRVEHKVTGQGPYSMGMQWAMEAEAGCKHIDLGLRAPMYDGMVPVAPFTGVYFGFINRQCLVNWFKHFVSVLKGEYVVRIYKAKPLDIGNTGQCIFERENFIKEISLDKVVRG